MTDAEKKMKNYTNEIERRLNLPMEVKARVMSDFISSIAARRESGQEDEAIMAELGSPKKVAAELNEQMKEFALKRNPWRFAFLALAAWGILKIFPGIWVNLWVLILNIRMSFSPNASVGIIGGADGPTAIFLASNPLLWTNYVLPALAIAAGIYGYMKLRKSE